MYFVYTEAAPLDISRVLRYAYAILTFLSSVFSVIFGSLFPGAESLSQAGQTIHYISLLYLNLNREEVPNRGTEPPDRQEP